ncbi:MAG: cellulase family glycosylhydrolase [Candidatus Omnitrophota bacterium]
MTNTEYRLKGVNLGGWLLMEGYILGGRNIPESEFKRAFAGLNGKKELTVFEKIFRDNFIQEDDIKNIASLGANAVRLPFNFRLIEKKPYCYIEEGFLYIERILRWADKYNIAVVLDLHAAPGAQNCDWHADSSGKADFWNKKAYRDRTVRLWQEIAARFKDSSSLAGYDIINEPVLGKRSVNILKNFYSKAIKVIRAIDKKHTIFLEGDIWAQRIDFLRDLISDNISISVHTYQPLEYVFNFTPQNKFPGDIKKEKWSKDNIYKYLEPFWKFSKDNNVRILVGEFGINWRGGFYGEAQWLDTILSAFKDYGFDYTYWTYKAIANHVFPDGIYQYVDNSSYIRREGPVYGWENYIGLWKKEKTKIKDFWNTKNYTLNKKIAETLSRHFRD